MRVLSGSASNGYVSGSLNVNMRAQGARARRALSAPQHRQTSESARRPAENVGNESDVKPLAADDATAGIARDEGYAVG